ncbi:TRAP transporter substrate-binding protein [Sporosarcina sp. P17b]|uniref:TRAP transporter substrate-binding protein n=1 Tax=Sporosarcina sp. P17b TaxID=2048260 RepID=UPI000C16BF3F|nr:TRAP transporter substrate-binding protein [Sporosarcina sp. P17b]PIC73382.1 TRAP transporter substrate-binding protein DctP [Sporosarcina sp. P17b]
MKKVLFLAMLSLVLVLAACGLGGNNDGDAESTESKEPKKESKEGSIVLNMSLPEGQGTKNDAGAQAFKLKLEELTNDELEVKIHYSNAFGGEREVYEMMGQNTLDLALQSSGPMGVFDEKMYMFDLPYLFKNSAHARAMLDGEVGDELAQVFEEAANVKILSWVENGFVVIGSTGKEIKTVEDLKGYKIRVQESEVQIDTWKAVGAIPTPMAWPEVYTSLQQGVIDGHDQALMVLETGGFDDIQDSVTILDARFVAAPISMSLDKFNSLSEEHQAALLEAAEYGKEQGRIRIDEMYASSKEYLGTEGGMEIIEFSDEEKQKYLDKVEGVYEKWSSTIGEDLIKKVQDAKSDY